MAPAPAVISSFIALMSAAVKAKAMAPAMPNQAARHAGDPNRVSRTATEHPAMTAKDTIPQSSRSGVSLPPPGAARTRKAASPPAAALAPTHSLHVSGSRNQTPRMAMRKGSSRVKMGWTVVRCPKCRARNCKRKAPINTTNPAIHTVRRTA